MNRDPIIFRVDATPQSGYERLARCLILAAALQRRRRPVYFMSQLEPRHLAFTIKRGGDWIDADNRAGVEDDLPDTIREIRRLHAAAVIVDEQDVTQPYLEGLASTGTMLVSIDHVAQIHFPSQLVINPMLGPSKEAYEFDEGTQLLLGRRYALVRPEIRRLRPQRSQDPTLINLNSDKAGVGQHRVMLALGEDDPNNHVVELMQLLLNTPKIGKVDVVVRNHHPALDNIRAMVEADPDRLELAVEPAEVAARVVRCHFAITNGSGWSQELSCIGVPQLLIVQSETHWPCAQRLEEEGCATCLGWHENVSPQTIRQAIQNLLSDPHDRQAMARCGRKLFDGRGPDRTVNALEIMLHAPRALGYAEAA